MPNPMNSLNRPRSAAALRHQTFDSHCLDVRVRGNAWQVFEKYQALARDAQSAGDRVAAENYLQHAEHYYRIIEAINEATAAEQVQRGGVPGAPVPPYGQQPETPTNFYGADGNLAQAPGGGAQPAAGNPAQAPAQATVTSTQPQPVPTSFFTPEEAEEHAVAGTAEALVARR
jgi:hypothetical protein